MPKFAANLTMMFNEVPFLERFQAAADAGFKAVEFMSPYAHSPEEVAARQDASGAETVLFNIAIGDAAGGERGIGALPGREADFRDAVATGIAYAKALRAPLMHVMAGIMPAGADRAECRKVFVSNLKYAAAEAARQGLNLVIEPINTRDIPGYFLNTQADGHAICEEVGAANLKVQMDFYHVQIVEGDIAMKVRKYLPQVAHIQIAGVPDRSEPDVGEVNYPYLFQLLDDLGYTGWIGCEYKPAKGTVEGLGWIKKYWQ